MLKVAQPAVDRLQAVPRGAAPEIARLDQGRGETALGGIPDGGRAHDPSPHDQQVEGPLREGVGVSLHRRSGDGLRPS
jgi:hypothetical protein